MEKYKSLLVCIPFLFTGFAFYPLISQLWYVKKNITINLDGDRFSFESNVNKEGDRYFFVIANDTVSSGIVENSRWINIPKK